MKHGKNQGLLSERKKEEACISAGFNSWKKAPKCFELHQQTHCHKAASSLETVRTKCANVAELNNQCIADSRQKERKHLIDVIQCLRFLARQGIAIQGNPGNDNFTQLLMLLGTKDPSIKSTLKRTRLKYTHNDIQNELLDLMAQHVIREKLFFLNVDLIEGSFVPRSMSSCVKLSFPGFPWVAIPCLAKNRRHCITSIKCWLKYTHNDIQNELLDLMAQHVIREKLKYIRENDIFSILADEYTDIRNLGELSMCVRTVYEDLRIEENFLGFYELNDIKSDTIVHAIKDVLLRSNLSIQRCRGQTYDGASNLMGKMSGVATQTQRDQPKAIVTHCHGHSLSLAIKDLTSSCEVLSNTMGTVGEICVLVKYSPKREKMLGSLDEMIEGEMDDAKEERPVRLIKLCTTRWTVRSSCFNKVFERYESLQK